MKKVSVVTTLVTLYAIFFQIALVTGIDYRIIYTLFFFSPFLVIYMAITILKNGKPSGHTFNEKFYDDHDYWRNGKEEMNGEE